MEMAGCALSAIVTAVKEDKVQIAMIESPLPILSYSGTASLYIRSNSFSTYTYRQPEEQSFPLQEVHKKALLLLSANPALEIDVCGLLLFLKIPSPFLKLTLEIMSGSSLMDRKKHLRSYQEPSMTYGQILKEIVTGYGEAGIAFSEPLEEKTGGLVLQYEETDWEFLKRAASRRHQFLVPERTQVFFPVHQRTP